MGYRHYFYLIEKEKAEALSNMKKEEFEKTYFKKEEADEVDCFPMEILWKLIGENKFWEFGKYYENEKGIHSCGLKLFKDEYISNFFGDANPYLCGPDAVLNAINWLKDEFVSYMRDCLMSDEEFEKAHGYKSTKKIVKRYLFVTCLKNGMTILFLISLKNFKMNSDVKPLTQT